MRPRAWHYLIPLALFALIIASPRLLSHRQGAPPHPIETTSPKRPATGDAAIADAFHHHRSGLWVESRGTVEKILTDDREGDRHQRFVLRLGDGRTLLFAHNIDVAPRVPLKEGDTIRFRGRYEWSDKGGVIHWTHADPRSGQGGWIERAGEVYR